MKREVTTERREEKIQLALRNELVGMVSAAQVPSITTPVAHSKKRSIDTISEI